MKIIIWLFKSKIKEAVDERVTRLFIGWLTAIRQQNKAIRRKNKLIKRLRSEIEILKG